jgi:flagellar FliL protein
MAVSAVKSEPAPAEEPPKAGKKSIVKLALVALIAISSGAGGAYWYFSQKDGEATKAVKEEPPKPPVFHALETFTVNLQLVDTPQFLQTGITLKVVDAAVVDEVKLHMPVVRDRILMLMSSRKAVDLLTVEGKRQLGEDIVVSVNQILGPGSGKDKEKSKAAAGKADAKAAEDDEDEKAEKDEKDGKDEKAAASAQDGKANGKAAPGAARATTTGRVQAVLFTSFIIQ